MATADKLSYLLDTKAAIKAAIINHGVSVSDTDTFRSYADKILAIPTGGDGGSTGGESNEDALLTGRIVTYTNNRIDYLRDQGLANYENLESITLSNVLEIGEEGLAYNPSLTTINLPSVTTVGMSCFRDDYALESISLPAVTVISAQCFYDCESLTNLTLSSSALVTLASTNAFTGTPIANGEGYIYVPANLVDTYKSAENWQAYADQIIAI